tara:strand:+ start:6952 stop:7431 length:480 start_codon:yes stop_codon:yes gene_type:complete
MGLVKKVSTQIKNHEIILGVILIIYLLSGVATPYEISPYITTIYSYGVFILLTVLIFLRANIFLGVLVGISFIELVRRSRVTHPKLIMPNNNYRTNVMNNLNKGNESIVQKSQLSNATLEEETVEKISIVNYSTTNNPTDYRPISSTTFEGVTELVKTQ